MTAPFYSDDWCTLYLGDCLEVRDWLAADVLITDPPYGTQMQASGKARHKGGYGRRNLHDPGDGIGARIANDETTEARDAMLAAWGDRPALLFGSPRMPDPPMNVADRLVWNKTRPGMNGGPWRYLHESIYVTAGFVRVNNSAVSIISAWPDQTDHIHAKPQELMVPLVSAAPPGTIADPFAGSGSTLVAAKALGRKAIGVELEERYCEIAARRLSQGVLDFGEGA
jgi:site-specific DNA-methyltransferase (adenine-specific)